MKFINKRYITIGILTLSVGVLAACAAAKTWWDSTTTVQGKVVTFILNPQGKIDGAVLDTGDQVRFGAETGEIAARQIKIGDALSATGRAGEKSDYGRELRAESLQIGDQTITVLNSKPKPPRDGERKPRHDDDKMPPAPDTADAPQSNVAPPATADANAPAPNPASPPAPIPMQTASVSGQAQIVLVGAKGEPRGLILSTGEQIDLPREVIETGLTFNQGTQISVEGEAAKSDFGTFIHPTRLTVGNQTFSFNR
ncbi:MAG: hypothetical protein ACR2N3_11275 [Pyrinomonadaceae bacterium]